MGGHRCRWILLFLGGRSSKAEGDKHSDLSLVSPITCFSLPEATAIGPFVHLRCLSSRSLTLPPVPPQPCRALRFVSVPASISPSIWGYLCSRGFVSGSRAANSSSSGLTSCSGNLTLLDASASVLSGPWVSTKLQDFQKIRCCLTYLIIR